MHFEVIGIESDGCGTVLAEFDNSGEARGFMNRYTANEDAGGWDRIEVVDTRGECAETLWRWERADADELASEVERLFPR